MGIEARERAEILAQIADCVRRASRITIVLFLGS